MFQFLRIQNIWYWKILFSRMMGSIKIVFNQIIQQLFNFLTFLLFKIECVLSNLSLNKKDIQIIVLKDLKSKFIKYQNYSVIKILKFSNEEEIFISGHDDVAARFWNVRMNIQLFLIKASTTEVSFIDLSPDNLWLAVLTDRLHIYKFFKCKLCLNQLQKQQRKLEDTEKQKNKMSHENLNQMNRENIKVDNRQSDLDNQQQDSDQNINSVIEFNQPICWRTLPFLEFIYAEKCFLNEAKIKDNQDCILNDLFYQKGAVREQKKSK